MSKEKTRKNFDEWLDKVASKDKEVNGFYVIGERHWDEGKEYCLCAFNQTEDCADEIRKQLWSKYVETEPHGFIQVVNGRKDLKFFDKHKDFTFDVHRLHGSKIISC